MSWSRTARDDNAFTSWVEEHGEGLLRSAYLLIGTCSAVASP